MTVFGVLLFFAVCGVIGVIFALMPSEAPREHYNPQRDSMEYLRNNSRRAADEPKPEWRDEPKPEDTGGEAWAVIHIETYAGDRYTLSSGRLSDEWVAYGGGGYGHFHERQYQHEGVTYRTVYVWENISAKVKLDSWLKRHTPDHSKAFWQSDTSAIRMSDVKTYYVEKHEA